MNANAVSLGVECGKEVDVELGASGLWLGTRTGASGTATLA
jgi:hypothetical protein